MGKFGCRLYCWGCGSCCIITGIVMGVLASIIPPSMMASIQESAFDLAYIDDTSQTEAEGLFADAGLPISESDAFKAWGKTLAEGLNDCLKQEFAFDWSKSPEDCIDAVHPAFMFFNATNLDSWSSSSPLEVQEVGPLTASKDSQKIEPDTSYWDETGKSRFRIYDTYTNSHKCDSTCEEFSPSKSLSFLNMWYGAFASQLMSDGWTIAHAVTKSPPTGTSQTTLQTYLKATEALPMDAHSVLPVTVKTLVRIIDFTQFMYTPDSPVLGVGLFAPISIVLSPGEYGSLFAYLFSEGKALHEGSASAYGVPKRVVPFFQKVSAENVLGWGPAPYWIDPISSTPFTFNFIKGFAPMNPGGSPYEGPTGKVPSAFMEEQMSSAYYHEGLQYVTQHFEMNSLPTTYNHSCAWDKDCGPSIGPTCYPTETCAPESAAGYSGVKIPGTYFGSSKGTPGFPAFEMFVLTYYLKGTMKSAGRVVVPAQYKGPDAKDEDAWAYDGLFAMNSFKVSRWTRRLENCNYPGGRLTESGMKDSQGIDCNFVKDTSPLGPFFDTLPVYWMLKPRDTPPEGWDPPDQNGEGGPNQVPLQAHVLRKTCEGNIFCTDGLAGSVSKNLLSYGYEPNLGALADVSLTGGLSWKLTITGMFHPDLAGIKLVPLFWLWEYLHVPAAFQMELSKLQGVPAALNGLYIFLLSQCMVSLIGGVACCFCGV